SSTPSPEMTFSVLTCIVPSSGDVVEELGDKLRPSSANEKEVAPLRVLLREPERSDRPWRVILRQPERSDRPLRVILREPERSDRRPKDRFRAKAVQPCVDLELRVRRPAAL